MVNNTARNIDEYLIDFPEATQEILQKIRALVHELAPEAKEAIKYAIPTFVLNGNLVHFAGYKNHIGFYPAPTGTEAFKEDLAPYKTGKGSVQFQLNEPIPYDLIKKIVQFRIGENLKKTTSK
ncbi:iron chaperone [Emticicia agri]|uniref:YdhG-like domain-containing protein n=1 Tax=Emticicia agri TaxID=2492393 RepID=A0A4V1ZDU5_9BACT|nr:DUF1801 domain-containing protein [Emticicia agri]RYU97380.1 hypothetical protein EWM59_01435 [Emticicia agri]